MSQTVLNIPSDGISFVLFLWNFSVVGTWCIFGSAPDILRQSYLVLVSAIMVGGPSLLSSRHCLKLAAGVHFCAAPRVDDLVLRRGSGRVR